MIHFIIHDEASFSAASTVAACKALRTFKYVATESLGTLRLHIVANSAPNNCHLHDDRFVVAASGTFIFKDSYGTTAISNLVRELRGGQNLSQLFVHFRGPFALVVMDREANEISILNPREGIMPFYRTEIHGCSAFSTSLLLLAALAGAGPSTEGLREFLHFEAAFNGRTLFDKIYALPNSTLSVHRQGHWADSRLWRLELRPPDPRARLEQSASILKDAMIRSYGFARSVPPGRMACDLTGGTDSRTALCCLLQVHPAPIASTSGPDDFVDVQIARKIVKRLGLESYWHEPVDTAFTDVLLAEAVEVADGSGSAIALVRDLSFYKTIGARFAFITGGAGGTFFKDHYWLFEFNRVAKPREPNWDRYVRFSMAPHKILEDIFVPPTRNSMRELTEMFRHRSSQVQGTNNQKLDFVNFDLRYPTANMFSVQTQFLNVFHPMQDAELIQLATNLPPSHRLRNALQFSIIHDLKPELDWILTNNMLPTIPPVGLNSWLRVFRGFRYSSTAVRKLRLKLFGASGERKNRGPVNLAELQDKGYFDLLRHSSLSFSAHISEQALAKLKANAHDSSNQHYLRSMLDAQMYFERVRSLRAEAMKPQP